MKTTELRVGNLIFHDVMVKEVVAISKDDIVVQGFSGVTFAFKPVPITKERLLSFGLIDREIKLNTIDRTLNLSAIVGGKYYFYLEDIDGNTFCLDYIEYVHQLQNLYFILTGTELEIK